MTAANASDVSYRVLDFDQLDGWDQDDHAAALAVFLSTCRDMKDPDWTALCKYAGQEPDARQFFELFFRPVLIEDGQDALFTGYFEPELDGDPAIVPAAIAIRSTRCRTRRCNQTHGLTRRQILEGDVMQGRGLEIAWVDDPVELFFLQIQGSGRIRLPNGDRIRVGYRGANGHPYRSIGVELVRRGIYQAHQVSAQVIRELGQAQPRGMVRSLSDAQPVLCVFSRGEPACPPIKGPLGCDEPVGHGICGQYCG